MKLASILAIAHGAFLNRFFNLKVTFPLEVSPLVIYLRRGVQVIQHFFRNQRVLLVGRMLSDKLPDPLGSCFVLPFNTLRHVAKVPTDLQLIFLADFLVLVQLAYQGKESRKLETIF